MAMQGKFPKKKRHSGVIPKCRYSFLQVKQEDFFSLC